MDEDDSGKVDTSSSSELRSRVKRIVKPPSFNERLDAITGDMEAMKSRIKKLEFEKKGLEAEVMRLSGLVEQMDARMAMLEHRIAELRECQR